MVQKEGCEASMMVHFSLGHLVHLLVRLRPEPIARIAPRDHRLGSCVSGWPRYK